MLRNHKLPTSQSKVRGFRVVLSTGCRLCPLYILTLVHKVDGGALHLKKRLLISVIIEKTWVERDVTFQVLARTFHAPPLRT